MSVFYEMARVIKPCALGEAEIVHWEPSDDDLAFMRLRAAVGHADSYAPPGRYVQLRIGGQLWISDTQMEKRTNMTAVICACGDVLIAGLGIGLVVLPIVQSAAVRSVCVIERSRDVIALVEPSLRRAAKADAKKLTVLEADALTWAPQSAQRFDYVYLDIWQSRCHVDEIPERQQLHRRYRRFVRRGGSVTSWDYAEAIDRRRRGEHR